MTEEEAKTKWCPFATARVVRWEQAPGMIVNSVWGDAPGVGCIASACMAWRPLYEDLGVWGRKAAAGGFCGLAGAPR